MAKTTPSTITIVKAAEIKKKQNKKNSSLKINVKTSETIGQHTADMSCKRLHILLTFFWLLNTNTLT